jgi:tetratricopeptide (TPR) repeat protein
MKRSVSMVVAGSVVLALSCGNRAPAPPPAATPAQPSAFPALSNDSPFSPAFTRVTTSVPIDTGLLGDPVQCVTCHADVAAQWEGSAHHDSSFANRFYALGVDKTRKDRGNKVSRWCAGCHDPSLLLADAKPGKQGIEVSPIIDRDDLQSSPRAGDGIGCLVCHSTTEASRLGGGGYLVSWRGFTEPDPKNAQSVQDHKKAMKAPVMKQSDFCASCHKVSLHADVNGKRWLRGQNDFDPWEQGPYAFGGEKSASVIYAPETPQKSCQDCHMKTEASSKGDLAGKLVNGQKVVKSHRFLAANSAHAAFAGDAATVAMQTDALAGVVRLDVMAIRRGLSAELVPEAKLTPGEQVAIDVVVENTDVGHKFPAGTVDSNEVWLAIDVVDAKGKVIARSGALDEKGNLGEEAHRFGVLQLDNQGVPATLRDAHRFVAAGWDTTIPPKDSRVVRFGLVVPEKAFFPLSVKARVRYRKFTSAYAKAACLTAAASAPAMKTCPELPIATVASDDVVIGAPSTTTKPEKWRRLDAYARGLLDALQEDVGAAEPFLAEVTTLAPDKAHGFVDLARMYIRQGRTADADHALDLAAKIDPQAAVVPILRGMSRYETYRLNEAVGPLRQAVALAPHAIHASELLGEALQLVGDDLGSIGVVQKGLLVDPESAQLRHLEALAFDKLGLPKEAEIARSAYLAYRRDDDTPALRSKCKAKVPGCAREATPLHVHALELLF